MTTMFKSKKDVDRHVTDLLNGIKNENEVRLLSWSLFKVFPEETTQEPEAELSHSE